MAKLFKDLCRALELTESENDEHADTIREVLRKPEFNINMHGRWDRSMYYLRGALHVACGKKTRSHVGAQLLLSDERCDINIQDFVGRTALIETVTKVKHHDDKHAKIMRLLLDHPRIDVSIEGWFCTALQEGCSTHDAHVGVQLLLDDARCDVNLQNVSGETPLMMAAGWAQSLDKKHGKTIQILLQNSNTYINSLNPRNNDSALAILLRKARAQPMFASSIDQL